MNTLQEGISLAWFAITGTARSSSQRPQPLRRCPECFNLNFEQILKQWKQDRANAVGRIASKPEKERELAIYQLEDRHCVLTSSFLMRDTCDLCCLLYENGMRNEHIDGQVFDVWLYTDNKMTFGIQEALIIVLEAHGKEKRNQASSIVPEKGAAIYMEAEKVEVSYKSVDLQPRDGFARMIAGPHKTQRALVKVVQPIPQSDFAARLVVPVYLTTKAYERFQNWLTSCALQHGDWCNSGPSGHNSINFALIDCYDKTLMYPERQLPHYAALSYVWGDPNTTKPKPERARDGSMRIPSPMPRTVLDAIEVTKGLGLRYLWVDQYCIDQTNPSIKAAQIGTMDQIYTGAAVVIIVASGKDSDSGIPGVSRPRRPCSSADNQDGRRYVSRALRPEYLIGESNWAQRGWTFQEGLLGRGRLIFTDEEVIYECKQGMHCESEANWLERNNNILFRRGHFYAQSLEIGPSNGLEEGAFVRLDNYNLTSITIARIAAYSKRKLTFDSDRLAAISGLLNGYCDHFAGLPYDIYDNRDPEKMEYGTPDTREQLLTYFLSWKHASTTVAYEPVRRVKTLPSLSWAGWTGGINFHSIWTQRAEAHPLFDLITMHHPENEARLGMEQGLEYPGWLEINARAFQVFISDDESTEHEEDITKQRNTSSTQHLLKVSHNNNEIVSAKVVLTPVITRTSNNEYSPEKKVNIINLPACECKRVLNNQVHAILLSKGTSKHHNNFLFILTVESQDGAMERVGLAVIGENYFNGTPQVSEDGLGIVDGNLEELELVQQTKIKLI